MRWFSKALALTLCLTAAASAQTLGPPGGSSSSTAPCSAFGTSAGTCAQGGVITAGGPTGGATTVPVITYNAAGQLTAVTTAATGVTTVGTAAVGQIPGTATNDSASAGNVGQVVDGFLSNPGSNVTTGVSANVVTISLTAGDWEVSGNLGVSGGATTTVNSFQGGISATTGTLDQTNGRTISVFYNNTTVFANLAVQTGVPPSRFSLASTTSIFLVCNVTFLVSTASCFGSIHAIRAR